MLVNNIIGAGIMPRAASGDDKLDRTVDALFNRWTAECDADGQLDFYGLQTLICREMVEAGEVLVRRRLRRSSDGLPVPLQLQVLEADFLDATESGALGDGRLVQGIEFDPMGKRRAYWLHAAHPGDAWGALQGGLGSRPVPATEIAHVYEKQRTQARGVPWGAPVIRSLRDLDDYEVAELVRKKTEACVTAIVFGDDEAQQHPKSEAGDVAVPDEVFGGLGFCGVDDALGEFGHGSGFRVFWLPQCATRRASQRTH